MQDRDVLDKARFEGRVVLTFDLDFGDLLALGLLADPSVILFRLSNETPAAVSRRLEVVLGECDGVLAAGALVVVEDKRYRVRRLPIA